MEQALRQLDDKYSKELAMKEQALSEAQSAFDMVVGAKEAKRQEIVAYYEALEKKIEADTVINQGEPII